VRELGHTGKIANAALSHPLEQAKQRRYELMTQLAEIFADIYAETAMPGFKEAA